MRYLQEITEDLPLVFEDKQKKQSENDNYPVKKVKKPRIGDQAALFLSANKLDSYVTD